MTDAVSTLQFPYATVPAPGEAIQIIEGIYWLRMPLPFALDHINLWALEEKDGWVLVDTGYGIDTTFNLWEIHFANLLSGKPVNRIIVTHYHPDHIGSADWLIKKTGAELWITEAEFLTAHAVRQEVGPYEVPLAQAHFARHGLKPEQLTAQETRSKTYITGVPTVPAHYNRLHDEDTIIINDHAWHIRTTFGHSPEHATLFCDQLGILVSGDQILPKITTNVGVWASQPHANPLKLFHVSIDKFKSLPFETIVLPSHGPVFIGLQERIKQLHEHHKKRLDELIVKLDKACTAAELLPVLFRRPLDDHQLTFAMGEIIAHLNFIVEIGKARRTVSSGGVIRYIKNDY